MTLLDTGTEITLDISPAKIDFLADGYSEHTPVALEPDASISPWAAMPDPEFDGMVSS
jgi:hypothetical protein